MKFAEKMTGHVFHLLTCSTSPFRVVKITGQNKQNLLSQKTKQLKFPINFPTFSEQFLKNIKIKRSIKTTKIFIKKKNVYIVDLVFCLRQNALK